MWYYQDGDGSLDVEEFSRLLVLLRRRAHAPDTTGVAVGDTVMLLCRWLSLAVTP
jgi:hypothetical protein